VIKNDYQPKLSGNRNKLYNGHRKTPIIRCYYGDNKGGNINGKEMREMWKNIYTHNGV
jgi:hypothetical protein